MPARDQQRKSAEGADAAADSADNPLGREAGRAPPTGRAVREVGGTDTIGGAIFLGADALALVQAKTVTLHSLTDAAADPVLLVDNTTGNSIVLSTASPDGTALGLIFGGGLLAVYDVAMLRAEPLSTARHKAQLEAGISVAGIAFSDDGARLLTLCVSGPVEVRDAWAEGLPVLRTLAFRGPTNGYLALHCAGGLAVAVGGGMVSIVPGAESRRARIWLLSGEREVRMNLAFSTPGSCADA
jgi:hypothetical protein